MDKVETISRSGLAERYRPNVAAARLLISRVRRAVCGSELLYGSYGSRAISVITVGLGTVSGQFALSGTGQARWVSRQLWLGSSRPRG